jgi:hypothetical protein
MTTPRPFARRVFTSAAVYGLIVMLPQYFMEGRIGRDYPPPITHPEFFYGFIGLVVVWQLTFLLIASDVQRYRPLMLVTVLEKLVFGIPALVLYAQGRLALATAVFGVVDLSLAAWFVAAYNKTRRDY